VVPLPSPPYGLSPQHCTAPLTSAQVCFSPAAMAGALLAAIVVHLVLGSVTVIGQRLQIQDAMVSQVSLQMAVIFVLLGFGRILTK
jgi:hypothetical protein